MVSAVEDDQIPIRYIPKFREYGIRVLDGGSSAIRLNFCPWCGAKLPESQRNRWYDEIEKLGLDPHYDKLPDIYNDERWLNVL